MFDNLRPVAFECVELIPGIIPRLYDWIDQAFEGCPRGRFPLDLPPLLLLRQIFPQYCLLLSQSIMECKLSLEWLQWLLLSCRWLRRYLRQITHWWRGRQERVRVKVLTAFWWARWWFQDELWGPPNSLIAIATIWLSTIGISHY